MFCSSARRRGRGNGWRWEAWRVEARTPRSKAMVVEVNIGTGDIGTIANLLMRLHHDSLDSR